MAKKKASTKSPTPKRGALKKKKVVKKKTAKKAKSKKKLSKKTSKLLPVEVAAARASASGHSEPELRHLSDPEGEVYGDAHEEFASGEDDFETDDGEDEGYF